MAILRELVFTAAGVLLPRGCCACSAPDEVLCPRCTSLFSGTHPLALPGSRRGCGYACARYTPLVRHAILGWKDHDDQECDGVFARALADLCSRIHLVDELAGRPLMVVPAPSTAKSIRRRGRWHMHRLAVVCASLLRTQGLDAHVGTVLKMRGVRGKAVEQSLRGQRSGRAGGVSLDHPEVVHGMCVVVLDDIVTTGATMRSCVRVLLAADADVITCLALARVVG